MAASSGGRNWASWRPPAALQVGRPTPTHIILATPPGRARQALAGAIFLLTEVPRQPTLVVEPDRGPCDTALTLRGTGFFPPGQALALTSRAERDRDSTPFAGATVGDDGAFTLRLGATARGRARARRAGMSSSPSRDPAPSRPVAA
jgi:hypothetical protein